jgi:hypothetical protein
MCRHKCVGTECVLISTQAQLQRLLNGTEVSSTRGIGGIGLSCLCPALHPLGTADMSFLIHFHIPNMEKGKCASYIFVFYMSTLTEAKAMIESELLDIFNFYLLGLVK